MASTLAIKAACASARDRGDAIGDYELVSVRAGKIQPDVR
jgi:hypothetical protein